MHGLFFKALIDVKIKSWFSMFIIVFYYRINWMRHLEYIYIHICIWNIHTHYVCTYDIIDISLILTLFKIDYILGKNKFLKPY